MRERFRLPVERPQRQTDVVLDLGIIGLGGERLLVVIERLLMTVRQAQRDAGGVVRLGKVRLAIERPLEQRDRLVEPALPDAQQAQVVERLGMVGVAVEDAAVKLFGFRQPMLLLQLQRRAEIPREPAGGV